MTSDLHVSETLQLRTVELLARAGLGLDLDGRVQVWADQVMDQMSDWPRQSDAIYVLAALHVAEILAAKGDDFAALKRLSRLWFDHEVDALKGFYLLKHAIRDVERHGTQPHWSGLTQDNWRGLLCDHCLAWQKNHPHPNSFTSSAAR